jgi:hypothetical protein
MIPSTLVARIDGRAQFLRSTIGHPQARIQLRQSVIQARHTNDISLATSLFKHCAEANTEPRASLLDGGRLLQLLRTRQVRSSLYGDLGTGLALKAIPQGRFLRDRNQTSRRQKQRCTYTYCNSNSSRHASSLRTIAKL